MALILAIESDRRQVNYLTAMVRGKLDAELVLGDTAEGALERLGDRVPDLILTSALLSPRDEQALSDRLRRLNGVAAHVQMLTLPVFAPPTRSTQPQRGGMLSALLGERNQTSAPDGCDPAVFAEQCKEYLRRATDERDARRHDASAHVPEALDDQPLIVRHEPTADAFRDSVLRPEPSAAGYEEFVIAQEPPASVAPAAVAPADSFDPSVVTHADAFEPPAAAHVDVWAPEATIESARQATPAYEAAVEEHAEAAPAEDEVMTVDIDLSELVAEEHRTTQAAAAPDEDEPAVYELSADSIELNQGTDLELAMSAPVAAAAPADESPAPEPEQDFDDWQKVIDALKRESAQVRVPRERAPEPPTTQASAATPASTTESHVAAAPAPRTRAAKNGTEPPRRRLRTAHDDWGMFDPKQAGMAALYERLAKITQDDEHR